MGILSMGISSHSPGFTRTWFFHSSRRSWAKRRYIGAASPGLRSGASGSRRYCRAAAGGALGEIAIVRSMNHFSSGAWASAGRAVSNRAAATAAGDRAGRSISANSFGWEKATTRANIRALSTEVTRGWIVGLTLSVRNVNPHAEREAYDPFRPTDPEYALGPYQGLRPPGAEDLRLGTDGGAARHRGHGDEVVEVADLQLLAEGEVAAGARFHRRLGWGRVE